MKLQELTEEQKKEFYLNQRTAYERIKHLIKKDDPKIHSSLKEAIEALKEMPTLDGTNFALVMDDEGEFKTYLRPHQPCQGGEMRKYWVTHGDACTRPFDRRPGDLLYPFPKGKPVAVSVDISWAPKSAVAYNALIDALYGPDSPYLKGFNSPDSVIKMKKDQSSPYSRLIFTDTQVDPTVFVNSLQYKNSINSLSFEEYMKNGFSEKEAMALCMLAGRNYYSNNIWLQSGVNTYYFTPWPSLRRIFEANPHDLSGGLFYDGYDYNRPEVQNLFRAEDDDVGVSFINEINRISKSMKLNTESINSKDLAEICRQILNENYYDHKQAKLEAA